MPVALLAMGLMARQVDLPISVLIAFLGGAVALFVVSLLDDFLTVSATVRFLVQLVAAIAFLWTVWHSWPAKTHVDIDPLFSVLYPPSPGFWLLAVWIVGVLNIYNFMDGIDGIAGLQAVVAGIVWWVVGMLFSATFVAYLGAIVAAGAAGFLTLNWPPARIFMGDAGSTVMGFVFATLPLIVVVDTKSAASFDVQFAAAALVVWPFLADGTFTILRRLKNGENVLRAHRSHLYQRLVISGRNHLEVTCLYGWLAMVGGVLACFVVIGAPHAFLGAACVVSVAFISLWALTVAAEQRNARNNSL